MGCQGLNKYFNSNLNFPIWTRTETDRGYTVQNKQRVERNTNIIARTYETLMHSRLSSEGLLGHDKVEVLEANLVAAGGCALMHFLQFLGTHCLVQLLCHALEAFF